MKKVFLICDWDDPGDYIGGALVETSMDEVAQRLEGEVKYNEEKAEYLLLLPADRVKRVWIDKNGKEIVSRWYDDSEAWIEDEELEAMEINPDEVSIVKRYLLKGGEISFGEAGGFYPINEKCAFILREVPLLL